MKYLLSVSVWLLLPAIVLAQTAKLKGKVVDNVNNPLPGVSVLVQNTSLGGYTNAEGLFEITGLNEGDYKLVISSVGFKTREVPVSISQNETDLGTVTLYEGDEILREVTVSGERENKFSRSNTAYVAKLPLRDFENTQVYSTITNYLLQS